MSGQILRAPTEGRIERTRALRFTFDGTSYWGYQGDTLASALLANGVRVVGRSFKYHRPRGIYAAGAEEPNALIQLRTGSRTEPNTRATQIELYDGLVAESQNRWPSVRFDLGAINNLLSPLFPAGFYYKTFMWPASMWMTYEAAIRRMAGLGRAPAVTDPDRYEKMNAHCDVLVVGGGPAGLAAALAAARTGARVIVAEQEPDWGGALRADDALIAGEPAAAWASAAIAELAILPEVTLLPRTTVFGYYDHGMIGAVERVGDNRLECPGNLPRQRFWKIRAKRVVLAAGSIERPIAFADNDRPGVMLASAMRHYANRFAVKAGQRVVIFTNNDSGYAAALDLKRIGADIGAIVDSRHFSAGLLPTRARAAGIEILYSHAVVRAHGAHGVQDVEIAQIDASGNIKGAIGTIHCDAVGVSGGWSPSVHLHSQSGGKVAYDATIAAFVPSTHKQAEESVGAARGRFALADCLADGLAAGARAAAAAGFGDGSAPATPHCEEPDEAPIQPLWAVAKPGGRGKRFVDIQDDVTADDIALAEREAFRSVEHLKRYTTLGMVTDQGKTSNVNGRSEERRVGKECRRLCRSRWSPYH
jgi:sarcosine oxidase subunit alpha